MFIIESPFASPNKESQSILVSMKKYPLLSISDLYILQYPFELELAKSENLNLGSDLEYTLENNILKLQTKNVNTDMIKIISQVEKKTEIKNINIIKSSLEDAFLKLTN